jgi:hypothetical protein
VKKPRNNARRRELFRERLAAGVCGRCGKRPRKGDCTCCVPCLVQKARWVAERAQRLRRVGFCFRCGQRESVGYSDACAKCLALRREYTANYYEKHGRAKKKASSNENRRE